jgi:hypothetical protein
VDQEQRLTAVIPATLEVEIRRIFSSRSAKQKVSMTPSQSINWTCQYIPVIPTTLETIGRRIMVQGHPGQKHETLPEK